MEILVKKWLGSEGETVPVSVGGMFLGLPDPEPHPLVRGTDPDPSLFSNAWKLKF